MSQLSDLWVIAVFQVSVVSCDDNDSDVKDDNDYDGSDDDSDDNDPYDDE